VDPELKGIRSGRHKLCGPSVAGRVNYAANRYTAQKCTPWATDWEGQRAVSAVFTLAYATEQEAGVPKARALDRVKNILAASTRQDWEAHGPRLWVRKGDTQLRIVDLTDDEGRMELKEQWAMRAGAGSVALRVELSICQGSLLLAKVPVVLVDSGRAFIPWPREEEDGRLVVAGWHYDLCRVISPGEYLGAYPVRSYLRRAGIVVK
jgi:hypothetical protein